MQTLVTKSDPPSVALSEAFSIYEDYGVDRSMTGVYNSLAL